MKRAQQIKAAVAAVVTAGAAAAALLVPGSPAVAYSSGGLVLDIKVQSPATLLDKGAAVTVPVQYTCSGTAYSQQVYVNLTQRVGGNEVATGSGRLTGSLVCNGEIQSVVVTVMPDPYGGGRAFAKGDAVAAATISACGSYCGQENDTETITIVSK